MGIYGQDWASYQSTTPDVSGLAFAFVKVAEGTSYVNPKWAAQRDHAKAAGLVWGAYHYPHMAADPVVEADFFLAQVAWRPGDLIALDWEGYDPANRSVPKATQRAYKEAWLRHVKARMPHNPVGMYANTDYWRNVDQSSYYADFLWIATAGLPAGQPGIQAPWLFHQYGASGVDRDYCHLPSRQALRDWALAFQPQPQPQPKPPTPAPKPPAPKPVPAHYTEDDMLAYLPIPANTDVDIPVDPSGTLAKPQGGARNGPLWLSFAPQGHDAAVTVTLHQAGKWGKPATHTVTVSGARYSQQLPADGTVDKVRVHTTAPLLAYVIGRQVA